MFSTSLFTNLDKLFHGGFFFFFFDGQHSQGHWCGHATKVKLTYSHYPQPEKVIPENIFVKSKCHPYSLFKFCLIAFASSDDTTM